MCVGGSDVCVGGAVINVCVCGGGAVINVCVGGGGD